MVSCGRSGGRHEGRKGWFIRRCAVGVCAVNFPSFHVSVPPATRTTCSLNLHAVILEYEHFRASCLQALGFEFFRKLGGRVSLVEYSPKRRDVMEMCPIVSWAETGKGTSTFVGHLQTTVSRMPFSVACSDQQVQADQFGGRQNDCDTIAVLWCSSRPTVTWQPSVPRAVNKTRDYITLPYSITKGDIPVVCVTPSLQHRRGRESPSAERVYFGNRRHCSGSCLPLTKLREQNTGRSQKKMPTGVVRHSSPSTLHLPGPAEASSHSTLAEV